MYEVLTSTSALVALAGVLGLLVGSFLNVVILRLPDKLMHGWKQQSREILGIEEPHEEAPPPGIVWEPSHCPKCKARLSVCENIPLFSWLYLRGRCRHCGVPISAQYPIVELLTGICSAIVALHFGFTAQALTGLMLTWTLIALSGIDLRTQLLPDQLTLPLTWLGLILSVCGSGLSPQASIVGAVVGYLSLWSVFWLFKLITGKEGMGYGDFKLFSAFGAWMGAGALLPIILFASLAGAIGGSIYLLIGSKQRSTPIPFGPFLAAAGWIWFVMPSVVKDSAILQAFGLSL